MRRESALNIPTHMKDEFREIRNNKFFDYSGEIIRHSELFLFFFAYGVKKELEADLTGVEMSESIPVSRFRGQYGAKGAMIQAHVYNKTGDINDLRDFRHAWKTAVKIAYGGFRCFFNETPEEQIRQISLHLGRTW